MVAPPDDPAAKGPLLARILRSLRRLRRRRLVDVAAELGIRQRTYEHFESGRGPLNVERVHRFAELLDVDPYGILAALEIGSSEFARRTADNKFMTAFHLQLQAFDQRVGDKLALLDAYSLLDAFEAMFADLEARAEQLQALSLRRPPDDGDTEPR